MLAAGLLSWVNHQLPTILLLNLEPARRLSAQGENKSSKLIYYSHILFSLFSYLLFYESPDGLKGTSCPSTLGGLSA
jgi:hypothetical protein